MAKMSDQDKVYVRHIEPIAIQVMEEQRVLMLPDFDDVVAERCRSVVPDSYYTETITGSSRTRILNLIDWVKAKWTREEGVEYFHWGGDKYLIWLQSCGHVMGNPLVLEREAWEVIRALVNILRGTDDE